MNQPMNREIALESIYKIDPLESCKKAAIFLANDIGFIPDTPELLLLIYTTLHDGKEPSALSCLRGMNTVWQHCRNKADELSMWDEDISLSNDKVIECQDPRFF